jgi:metal-responsive CopG/Arc/MetJ family transcriptional regulator
MYDRCYTPSSSRRCGPAIPPIDSKVLEEVERWYKETKKLEDRKKALESEKKELVDENRRLEKEVKKCYAVLKVVDPHFAAQTAMATRVPCISLL